MTIQKEPARAQPTERSSLPKRIIEYLNSLVSEEEKLELIDTLLFSFSLKTDLIFDDALTEREQECLRLATLGYSSRKAARILNLSRKTVEAHQYSIKRKLKCKNFLQVVMEAIKRGYINIKN